MQPIQRIFNSIGTDEKPVLNTHIRGTENSGDKSGTKLQFMAKTFKWAKGYRGKTGNPKEKWFAYYSYLNKDTGLFQRFKVYEGLNYIHDLAEKEEYLQGLITEINHNLKKKGYNPFITEQSLEFHISETSREEKEKLPLLTEAFAMFMEKKKEKKLSATTIHTYESFISILEGYLLATKAADIRVNDLTIDFIEKMLTDLQAKIQFGDSTYNNYLGFWRVLLNWFARKPRHWLDIKNFDIGEEGHLEMRVTRPMKHQYFGEAVLKKVKKAMEQYPKIEHYAMFIYYSCMRPEEILNLKIENVDLSGRYIKIVGKTKNRVIPICDELAEMLAYIKDFPTSYYVIGRSGVCCDVQHGIGYFSDLFKDYIREPLKLSSNFTLYGFKHTRVVHLLNAGYSDAEVMNLTGHKDTASFDKYKRELMGNINSKLRGKTIAF